MEEFSSEKIYSRKILLLIIPIVGAGIWLIYYAINGQKFYDSTITEIIHSIFSTTILWLGCFSITTYLWKKFPWEIHPKKHLIIEILSITIYTNVFAYLSYLLAIFGNYYPENSANSIWTDIIIANLITILITTIHEAIFFYRQWKFNFSKSAQLEKENIKAKFETLKSQINPHFLFNSLNSLFELTECNPQAQTYIQDLSDFLRYSIQNRNSEFVSLDDEITIVKKYLAIQKTRFGKNLETNIEVSPNSTDLKVPILAIQSLVENCIKHNIISEEKPLTIKVKQNNDVIEVSNNLQLRIHDESNKQGLENLKNRYSYFTTDEITIHVSKTQFIVRIPILKF